MVTDDITKPQVSPRRPCAHGGLSSRHPLGRVMPSYLVRPKGADRSSRAFGTTPRKHIAWETKTQVLSPGLGEAVTHSTRVELQFPVGLMEGLLRQGGEAQRLSSGAPVFLPGVLEDLTVSIRELAGKGAQKGRKVRISPEHVRSVVDCLHLGHLLHDDTGPRLPGGLLLANRADSLVPAPGNTSATASSSLPNCRELKEGGLPPSALAIKVFQLTSVFLPPLLLSF